MKVRAAPKSITLELGRSETGLPPVPLPELALKNILVPVDFSESSRKAVHYAVSFAKQFNAQILLLHILEPIPPAGPDFVIGDNLAVNIQTREQAAKHLGRWRKAVASQAPIRTSVQTGSPDREIVRMADENNIDLIVLGTRGRTGLSHLLLGSTAERVMRHAPCPVMIIREREHDFLARKTD